MSLGLYRDLSALQRGLTSFTQAVDKLRQIHCGITIQILSVQLLLPTHIPSSSNDTDILTATLSTNNSLDSSGATFTSDHTYRIQSGMVYNVHPFTFIHSKTLKGTFV